MDILTALKDFIVNLISSIPDIFEHLLDFLNDILSNIIEMFETGQILVAVLVLIILFKIISNVRGAL